MVTSKSKASRAQPLTFGAYVARLRSDSGLSLRALSKRTGISLSSLFRLERGDSVPSVQRNLDAIDRLWHVLGGDMNQLLYLSRRCPACNGLGTVLNMDEWGGS